MAVSPKIPLPLEPIKTNALEDRRLWVGNLDLRINEFQLLKILQTYGEIEKFDLLFHRSGPQAGQPRGYAFVTYTTVESAVRAKDVLNNAKLGIKNVVVRWAHTVSETEMDKAKPKIDISALAGPKKGDTKISRETTIQAIEAKLKLMSEAEEEFQLNKPLEGSSVIQHYQKPEVQKASSSRPNPNHHHHSRNHSRPYFRTRSRR